MKSPRNDSSMLHPSAEVLPYGFWPSDWSAEAAAAASRDFAELRAGQGGLFWIEYDPAEGRCSLWFWQAGQACCVTPAGYSVRSRVYEYGGGAFCLTGQGSPSSTRRTSRSTCKRRLTRKPHPCLQR